MTLKSGVPFWGFSKATLQVQLQNGFLFVQDLGVQGIEILLSCHFSTSPM